MVWIETITDICRNSWPPTYWRAQSSGASIPHMSIVEVENPTHTKQIEKKRRKELINVKRCHPIMTVDDVGGERCLSDKDTHALALVLVQTRPNTHFRVHRIPDKPTHSQPTGHALNVRRIRRCPHKPASRHRQCPHWRPPRRPIITQSSFKYSLLAFFPSFLLGLWNYQGWIRWPGSSKMLFPFIVRPLSDRASPLS